MMYHPEIKVRRRRADARRSYLDWLTAEGWCWFGIVLYGAGFFGLIWTTRGF